MREVELSNLARLPRDFLAKIRVIAKDRGEDYGETVRRYSREDDINRDFAEIMTRRDSEFGEAGA